MIGAVFLCDKQGKIKKVRECCTELGLNEGDLMPEPLWTGWRQAQCGEKRQILELSFPDRKEPVSVVIDPYKEADLVVLARIRDHSDFLEFEEVYPELQNWAKDQLFGLFHDEYFLIQQMNNQLVDVQRKLTRSNRRLEYALEENKEINEQLEKARILAEQANDSKTKFLANMSHDIRTPMNAIVGLTELMQHHLDEPEILKNYLEKLQSSGRYLLDLINDILDLSKIESGSLELKPEPMDIDAQIEQVVTIIRPRSDKKKQKLFIQREETAFGLLMGDAVRFRQILMNLLSNAVKYTPEGGTITFGIEDAGRTERVQTCRFLVEDNGIGMTPEFISHIFEPFSRADTDVKEIQGTGLGMAITKRIIDAMGGSISVESTPGKGSRFCVEIPFEICSEKAAGVKESKLPEAESDKPGTLKGMRFLCAEDNELNTEILTAMLELEGASCVVYGNGKLLTEAFRSVQPGEYDAILMDVQMPEMNGLEATKAIRNSENLLGRTIPIVAMTANAFSEDVEQCLAAGMDAHVTKPIDIAALEKALNRLGVGKSGS